jgi:signal transduction histidine kinase
MGCIHRHLLLCLLLAPSARAEMPWTWLNVELRQLEAKRLAMERRMAALPPFPQPQLHERAGFHSGIASAAESVRWVQVDLGAEWDLEAVVVIPALLGGGEAYGFPKRFRVDASNDALFAESVTLLDHTHEDAPALLAPWHVTTPTVKARHVRFTATKLALQPGLEPKAMFALGEMLVFSGGRNVALGCRVEAAKAVETLPTWSPKHLVDGTHALGLPIVSGGERRNGWHSGISTVPDSAKWVEVDLGSKRAVEEIRLIPAHPSDYPDRFGFGFPRRFKVEADGETIFDSTGADFTNPGDTSVVFPTPTLQVRTIRLTATKLWERSGDFVFALAELQAIHGGHDIARGAVVTSLDETATPQWRREHLVDGHASAGSLMPEEAWLSALSERRELTGQARRVSALSLKATKEARKHAAWLASGTGLAALVGGWMWLVRLRRARHLELETLRQRISRDLHDDIGSHLGSIRLMSELALRENGGDESLQEIHRLAGEAAESMRGIIWLVREGDAPRLSSLANAIRQSAAALLKGVEWHMEVQTGDDASTASLEFHRQTFLFFREAAHNVARHAGAAHAVIRLGWEARRFQLRLEDDGRGFDPASIHAGHGLANLRQRAQILGGTLRIEAAAGRGTSVTLEAPIS